MRRGRGGPGGSDGGEAPIDRAEADHSRPPRMRPGRGRRRTRWRWRDRSCRRGHAVPPSSVDEHGERMGKPAAAARPGRSPPASPRVTGPGAGGDAHRGADLRRRGHDAAAEQLPPPPGCVPGAHDLRWWNILDDREGPAAPGQPGQDDALQRLLVLGEMKLPRACAPRAPPASAWRGCRRCPSAHGELGLELRVVGAEAERRCRRAPGPHAGEQRVDVRLAGACRGKCLRWIAVCTPLWRGAAG